MWSPAPVPPSLPNVSDDDSSRDPSDSSSGAVPGAESAYWTFYDQLAAAQLAEWAPTTPSTVLDLSGGRSLYAAQLATAGHTVLHVRAEGAGPALLGLRNVVADSRDLAWVQDGSVDAVLAESRALSRCLAAELTAEHLARVLRPGGRLLLVVDSLLQGLARLAGQGRWAELADVPSADCVLVAAENGTITRCFSPVELQALLEDVGLLVDWVRPRSVLAVAAVERTLAEGGPEALTALVRTELTLARERAGECTGLHLVASARRP